MGKVKRIDEDHAAVVLPETALRVDGNGVPAGGARRDFADSRCDNTTTTLVGPGEHTDKTGANGRIVRWVTSVRASFALRTARSSEGTPNP